MFGRQRKYGSNFSGRLALDAKLCRQAQGGGTIARCGIRFGRAHLSRPRLPQTPRRQRSEPQWFRGRPRLRTSTNERGALFFQGPPFLPTPRPQCLTPEMAVKRSNPNRAPISAADFPSISRSAVEHNGGEHTTQGRTWVKCSTFAERTTSSEQPAFTTIVMQLNCTKRFDTGV